MHSWKRSARRLLASLAGGLAGLGLSTAAMGAEMPKDYTGHHVVHVHGATQAQLTTLENAGVVVLDCASSPDAVDMVRSPQQLDGLRSWGIQFEIKHEKLQALIDAERVPSTRGTGDAFEDYLLDS